MNAPCVSFHFSYKVGALYALEMMLETHLVHVEVRRPVPVFDQSMLERCHQELSPSSFFWHLRPLIAIKQNLDQSLRAHYRREIAPLLGEVEETYKPHWKKILPTLKKNTRFLKRLWKEHGDCVLNEIANVSRHLWKVKDIKVFILEPIVCSHGDAFPEEGIVTIEGVRLGSLRSIIGFVHEVAHINTMPPFVELPDERDIRSKVLYEIANEYVAQQSLVSAGLLPSLDNSRLERVFSEYVRGWMTESESGFTYDSEQLRQIVDRWWIEHLRSFRTLAQSFQELQRKALPRMTMLAS